MYTYEIYFGQQLLAVDSNFRKAADFARQILIAGFPVTFNRVLKRVPDQIVYVDVNGTVSYLRNCAYHGSFSRILDYFDHEQV